MLLRCTKLTLKPRFFRVCQLSQCSYFFWCNWQFSSLFISSPTNVAIIVNMCFDLSVHTLSVILSTDTNSPHSNIVNGHMSTMWLMVCCWPQSQEGDWARLAQMGSRPIKFLWFWSVMDHESHCRHVPINKGGLNVCHEADDDTVIWLLSVATAALAK